MYLEGIKRPSINGIERLQRESFSEPIPHDEILLKLLGKVEPIDYRELAGLEKDEKLGAKHFQVITIEQILILAKKNGWGFCRKHDFIYLYNGAYWSMCDDEQIKAFLGQVAEKMGVEVHSAKSFQFRDVLFKQFITMAYLPIIKQAEDLVLINLKNGTFEITSKGTKLRQFNPEDFLTYQLPFGYNPEATAPMFIRYLDRVLPDEEAQRLLSEFLGYVFVKTSTLKLEKVLLLYGDGQNGKSVLFDIVQELFGKQNTSEFSLQNLTDVNGYYRAMIGDKLVNYCSEISTRMNIAIFKQLASCEPIDGRLPHGNPLRISDYAKLIFNTNTLLQDVEQTNAFFRRFAIIPFNVTISDAEKDPDLAKKITSSELSGVFNWVLDGLERILTQRKFSRCEASEMALKIYKTESDSVKMFLEEEGYMPSLNESRPLKVIYAEYKFFCDEGGYRKCSNKTFSDRLKKIGFSSERRRNGMELHIEKNNIF